jgi:hypothetical protein
MRQRDTDVARNAFRHGNDAPVNQEEERKLTRRSNGATTSECTRVFRTRRYAYMAKNLMEFKGVTALMLQTGVRPLSCLRTTGDVKAQNKVVLPRSSVELHWQHDDSVRLHIKVGWCCHLMVKQTTSAFGAMMACMHVDVLRD